MISGCYFFGLWLTVKKVVTLRRPYLGLFISFFVRLVLCLGAFYLFVQPVWFEILPAMVGFLVMRFFSTQWWGLNQLEPPSS